MLFNKELFSQKVSNWSLSSRKVKFNGRAGLIELLSFIEADDDWEDIRQVANFLAQIYHETAATFKPIREFRAREGTTARRVQDKYWFTGFYGRGYIQLTHKSNYQKLGGRLNISLVQNPDMALNPIYSYEIAALGMREGLFTGAKLSDYINENKCDYYSARRIVNGTDKAVTIQAYSVAFERICKDCLVDEFDSHVKEDENISDTEEVRPQPESKLPGTMPEDAPLKVEGTPANKVSGIKAWVASTIGTISSLGLSLGSVGGVVTGIFQNEKFTGTLLNIGIISLVFAGLFGLTYLILRAVGTARERRMAHELTLKQLDIRANPKLYNVEVVKTEK